jgi:transcriptional regulator with XRE-family HTH domain
LANKAGIYNDNLRNIINGATRQPRIGTINRIANALGVTYTRFMAGPSAEEEKPKETVLPYDTEVDEPAEEICVPDNERDAIQVEPEPAVVAVNTGTMPEWLDAVLKEEIMEAHAGFKSSTKAADKKCYASVVSMHAALYTRSGSH